MSDLKIVSLMTGGVGEGAEADVVNRLKSLLEQAEKGEIVGLTAAWVDGGGNTWIAVSPGRAKSPLMMAAVADLFHAVSHDRMMK